MSCILILHKSFYNDRGIFGLSFDCLVGSMIEDPTSFKERFFVVGLYS
jgi:hypothetical protein